MKQETRLSRRQALALLGGAAFVPFSLARADVFLTDEGPRVCEINCDTPSGEAEAVTLGAHARRSDPTLP